MAKQQETADDTNTTANGSHAVAITSANVDADAIPHNDDRVDLTHPQGTMCRG